MICHKGGVGLCSLLSMAGVLRPVSRVTGCRVGGWAIEAVG